MLSFGNSDTIRQIEIDRESFFKIRRTVLVVLLLTATCPSSFVKYKATSLSAAAAQALGEK